MMLVREITEKGYGASNIGTLVRNGSVSNV